MIWSLKEIIELCQGELYSGNDNIICENFSKDTRTLEKDDIYIGIKGENYDGNEFYQQAFDNDAKACILDRSIKDKLSSTTQNIILVENTIDTLAKLATATLKKLNIPIIAVTGSVGKTSTKDMIYSILSKKYKTLKTIGNYNNNIGLPLTILKLKDEECAVIEMGMNGLHEISELSKIVSPDIAIITNIAPSHIGLLGSMENILQAKLEIIDGLKKDGILIINNDNEYLRNANISATKYTYSINTPSNLKAYDIEIDSTARFKIDYEDKPFEFEIKINTENFILNALAAISVGIKMNIPMIQIVEALKDFELTSGRLELIKCPNKINIINDAYNANTLSMKNGLDFLKNAPGDRKIAILGDMLELGEYSIAMHREVGEYVALKEINFLITIGTDAKYIYEYALKHGMSPHKIKYFINQEMASSFIESYLAENDTVLVKASNGMNFKTIVELIKNMKIKIVK